MWDTLSRTELEAAGYLLKGRREEMLRRHAEELGALDRDQVEVDALDRLIRAFVSKFNTELLTDAPVETTDPDGKSEDISESPTAQGISLLITQTQKSRLRAMGVGDEQIRNLTPGEAHRMLGVAS